MRRDIDRLMTDLDDDNESIDTIMTNLRNLDQVLNKVVYFKS